MDISETEEDDCEKPKFKHVKAGEKVPLVLYEDPLIQVRPFQFSSSELITNIRQSFQVPATINRYLCDYQREGIRFLFSHHQKGEGALLADDMGLGKTVQVLLCVTYDYEVCYLQPPCFHWQVIGFLAAILGKTGTKIDVMRLKPLFIRQVAPSPSLCSIPVFVRWILECSAPFSAVSSCWAVWGQATAAISHHCTCQRPLQLGGWTGDMGTLCHWVSAVLCLMEKLVWVYLSEYRHRKYHKQRKEDTMEQLRKGKLDVVVTTYETCRDNIVSASAVFCRHGQITLLLLCVFRLSWGLYLFRWSWIVWNGKQWLLMRLIR